MSTQSPAEVGVRPARTPTPGERAGGPPARSDRGAVTAETVMMLPVLVATALGLVWLLVLAVTQVRVTDAAREVARAVARDEPRSAAVALGRQVAPPGATIGVREQGSTVVVHVEAQVAGPVGLFGFVPSLSVDAEAVTAAESR